MARPRTPTEKARITGRDRHDPARFQGRADVRGAPLGEPSPHLPESAKQAWESFRREVPWLHESDRCHLEVAAYLRGRLMAGEEVGISALDLLRRCLGQMGATPSDASKVAVDDDGADDDPGAKYFN